MIDIISKRPSTLLSKQGMTPYCFEYGGYEILVERDVFPPDLSASSLHLFDILGNYKADCSLDMGCGTGILAMQLSRNSVITIAADNHMAAINNTNKNIILNNINNIKIIHSNLYQKIQSNYIFDLIVFNHPYYPSKKNKNFGIDCTGGACLIENFLLQSKEYLSNKTRIIMPYSDFAGQENNPILIAIKLGFSCVEVFKLKDKLGCHFVYELKYVAS
ncbi:MAG: methyltransferase [Thermodesulfobacteriota bacterium]